MENKSYLPKIVQINLPITVAVKINEKVRKEFFVNDVYKARFPVTIRHYPKNQIPIAKSFKAELENGDVFEREILKIHNRKFFVGKTPIDDMTSCESNHT